MTDCQLRPWRKTYKKTVPTPSKSHTHLYEIPSHTLIPSKQDNKATTSPNSLTPGSLLDVNSKKLCGPLIVQKRWNWLVFVFQNYLFFRKLMELRLYFLLVIPHSPVIKLKLYTRKTRTHTHVKFNLISS